MKLNSIEKSFTNNKILKIDFHVSLMTIKSVSRTFCGSIRNEINVKQIFHEMF